MMLVANKTRKGDCMMLVYNYHWQRQELSLNQKGSRENPYFPIIQFFFMMLVANKTRKGDCMMVSAK